MPFWFIFIPYIFLSGRHWDEVVASVLETVCGPEYSLGMWGGHGDSHRICAYVCIFVCVYVSVHVSAEKM